MNLPLIRNVSIGPTRRGRARVRQGGRRAGPGGPRARRRRRGGTTTLRGADRRQATGADRERRLRASAGGRRSSPSSRIAPGRFGDRGRRSLSRGHRDRPARPTGPDAFGARQARRSRRTGERRDGLGKRAARPRRTVRRRSMDDGGARRRPPSAPSMRRISRLARPASSAKAPAPARRRRLSTRDRRRRTSSLRPERRTKRSLAGRTGRRTISRVSKTCSPASGTRPGLAIPLAPIDGFLGVSAARRRGQSGGDAGPIPGVSSAEIKQVDPSVSWTKNSCRMGGIAGLTWQGRTNLINNLRMQRAAAYYRMRGDVGPPSGRDAAVLAERRRRRL